jgi:hypothetical protein
MNGRNQSGHDNFDGFIQIQTRVMAALAAVIHVFSGD